MPASRSLLLRLLVALAALTFLTAACGGDDSGDDKEDAAADTDGSTDSSDDGGEDESDDEGGLPNPCELITLAELETAFGFAWAEGEYTPPTHGTSQCVWSDADPGMPAKIVSLAIGTDDSFGDEFNQSAKDLYEGTKDFASAEDILEDDLGLGDASYRTQGGIYVLDGDTYYSFTTIGGVSDDAVAGLKAMAATVVG